MIAVSQAEKIILSTIQIRDAVMVSLADAMGRILQEEIYADRDFPPYDRVAMDGIALRSDVWEQGQRRYRIRGTQTAGSPPQTLKSPDACIEVMTGAVCPIGADLVVRYEDIELVTEGKDRYAMIADINLHPWKNIHRQGLDRKQGDSLLRPGIRLGAPEAAIAATVGKTHLRVSPLPRLMLISTGDELVEVGQKPLPHQIRSSNVAMMRTLFRHRAVLDHLHLPDDKTEMTQRIATLLNQYDALIFSGGVSKGKADHIPAVMQDLGIGRLFHRVAQRPGKPMWFGRHPSGTVIFALPGNPVSCLVCSRRYVQPWLEAISGQGMRAAPSVRLSEDFSFEPALHYFLPVKIRQDAEGIAWALPFPGQGSGDLASLSSAEGILELPADRQHFKRGAAFPFWGFR